MIKVFVSHSSEDKSIVSLFKDIILKSGIGLKDENIFFTSAPETGVPIGENIPDYIKRNLMDCDYVFLMISDNYKKSEVCLNEMGAAMVIGKKLFPILLYNYAFDRVGWLIDRALCVRIDDEERLDEIRDIFCNDGISVRTSIWNRSRNEFMEKLSCSVKPTEEIAVKGLLDYQMEIEANWDTYSKSFDHLNEGISHAKDNVSKLIEKHNASFDFQERKMILVELASVLNKWANEMACLIPKIHSSLINSLSAVEEILKNKTVSIEEKVDLINRITDFQIQCKSNYETLINNRNILYCQADMEEKQMIAKRKVLKEYDSLLYTFDVNIKKIDGIILLRYQV